MVGYHPWFQIIVAHKVCNICYLVFKALLAGKHSRTSRVKALHYGIQFLCSIDAFIILIPCFLHLIAYAPHDYRGMITVPQHHVSNVLMSIIVIERCIIAGLPLVESLIEHQQSERIADGKKLW